MTNIYSVAYMSLPIYHQNNQQPLQTQIKEYDAKKKIN